MTENATPAQLPTHTPAPTGVAAVKAKAMQVAIKGYMAAPPPVQQATIKVVMKAQPAIAKVQPYAKKIVAGSAVVVVVRSIKRRFGS